ncbi:D-alanyl-D-alanine carboxypeptidase/D-alanyl-D-alanine endopeptidase [Roseovarius salis]|uniref:D-alanyl-D-alanine carboxypeptidase/D-alanyl-D-alanine endopeptidase n=1 Tax=Roseovarius salis TaxID=3376063 RepID=UPI0037C6595B
MVTRVSRRLLLGGALGSLAGLAWAGAPDVSLRPRRRPTDFAVRSAPEAEALVREARLGGQVSYAVVDVSSGRVVESRRADAGQPPASVTKAVTALYALDVLGASYRFQTRLLAAGTVRDGVLDGDLVLAGGGDPTLDTDALADMAARLKKSGVREVRGKLRVWTGALPFERVIDRTQPEHVGYNPSISGLNLNYNRVRFEWKRAGGDYAVTLDARSAKYRPEVRVSRMSVARRRMPVYTYSDKGDHDAWTVARAALGNGGARWLPVRKPGAYAAEVFATFARSHGVVLEIGAPLGAAPTGRVLVTHKSAPLSAILRGMLKYSNNLTAELVGMTATARRRGRPMPMRVSAREMSRWARARLGMRDTRLVDHSGLGEASRLSAGAMASALAQVHGKAGLQPLLKTFSMSAGNGPGGPAEVAAKTGTLYFVSSLAGYMTAASGRDFAFAIFTADTDRRSRYDPSSGQRPEGARGWNSRAKRLQQRLLARWERVHGG